MSHLFQSKGYFFGGKWKFSFGDHQEEIICSKLRSLNKRKDRTKKKGRRLLLQQRRPIPQGYAASNLMGLNSSAKQQAPAGPSLYDTTKDSFWKDIVKTPHHGPP